MKTHRLLPLLLLALVSAVRAADSAPAASAAPAPKKILFFTKSVSYEHAAIKAGTGYAFPVVREFAAKNNLEITESKDGSLFSDDYLAKFDAFMFYTQDGAGALATAGRDGAPPMAPGGKEALLKAVAGGKGFIAMHSASDTFHSVLPDGTSGNRGYYIVNGDGADPYIKMLGGEFIAHGAEQPGKQIVVDAKFPGIAALPADFGPTEEWYTMKNFPADLHVILMQDTAGMNGNDYARPPFPSTWARMQGKGRVFYTSMGHREDVWKNPGFQAVLFGGINWALGRVDADITPNLAKVAPKANEIQVAQVRGGRRGGGPPGGAPRGGPPAPAGQPAAPAAPATPAAQ